MKKMLLNMVLWSLASSQAGCSLCLQHIMADGAGLESRADIPRIDLSDPNCGLYGVKLTQSDEGAVQVRWEANSLSINMPQEFYRVKYHRQLDPTDHRVVVEGIVAATSRKYPVAIDTGCHLPVLLNDIHVLENSLAIYPFSDKHGPPATSGLCHLPELRMGEVTFVNPPCIYMEKHPEVRLFGLLPVASEKEIIMGLPLVRAFKYVAIDGLAKEVEFSGASAFQPVDQSSWSRYPLSIGSYADGVPRIFVEINIAGQVMNASFDTGASIALCVRQRVWQTLRTRLTGVRSKNVSLFLPLYGGTVPATSFLVPELSVGERIVKNAVVSVFPDDSPLFTGKLKRCDALIGMQCFSDTIMVLDFSNNLMWVKNGGTD